MTPVFTLSGTTLTANNGGNVYGIYYDTAATTDDIRAMASVSGTASTAALTDGGTAYGSLGIRANTTLVADSWNYVRVILDPDGRGRDEEAARLEPLLEFLFHLFQRHSITHR